MYHDLQDSDALFLCDKWKSSRVAPSTIIRELAVNLAKLRSIKVHCYVLQSDEADKEDANRNGVNLITAQPIPGLDPMDRLKIPPPEISRPDVVIGYGEKFGSPAYFIKRYTKCKRIQFVNHACPEDFAMFKLCESPTREEMKDKYLKDIELCKEADKVVAVGSLVQDEYQKVLSLSGIKVETITPGVLEEFSIPLTHQLDTAKVFKVFVFNRATCEDFVLKGYDIIGNVIASLGEKFALTFVGSPPGQHREVWRWFQEQSKIKRQQLILHSSCTQEEQKDMLKQADVVVLPSRTEGFGLVALEAISAAIPVLVSNQFGIAKALERVEGGDSVIVECEDSSEWVKRIRQLSKQTVEERLISAMQLRENYEKIYSWHAECEKIEQMIHDLVEGSQSFQSKKGCWSMASALPSFASTKETTNYVRLCRLLVDVGSQALRDTFDSIHPPAGLHLVLGDHPQHALLQSLRKKKILNPTQWSKLYPTIPSSVSSASFDITLLMILLRNICGLHAPATGWDNLPPPADISKEANIARVKYYRNTVYAPASQASVDDATFNTYWQDIGTALVGLGGTSYGAAINKLKNECMDPDMEEHYRELLGQWKKDEDSIKDKLEEIEGNIRDKLGEEAVKQGTPRDTELEELGAKIEANFKKLGRRLGIKDDMFPDIHQAHDELSERGYYRLKNWKRKQGSDATYRALNDPVKHQDLGEQFWYIMPEHQGFSDTGVYLFIRDLIVEGKDAWLVNDKGRFGINWLRAPMRFHTDFKSRTDTIDSRKASNNLRSALLNSHEKDGAKEYIQCQKKNAQGKICERQFQMPPRIFESMFGSGMLFADDGSECETGSIASEDSKGYQETLSSSESGFDEAMDISYAGFAEALDISCDEKSEIHLTENKSLHLTAKGGNIANIEELLSQGCEIDARDSDEMTPLMIAAFHGRAKVVKFLLKKGASAFLKSEDGSTLLHFASWGGNVAIIEEVVKQGVNIDSTDNYDNTPLMYAASNGKIQVVDILLKLGADPFQKGRYGRNSLHWASLSGNIAVIEALLSHSVEVDSRDWSGKTSLMYAASFAREGAVMYLLNKGANPSLKSNLGKSLLHFSSQGGSITIIEAMLSHGLDINSRDVDCNTPLNTAVTFHNVEAEEYLLSKGAKKKSFSSVE